MIGTEIEQNLNNFWPERENNMTFFTKEEYIRDFQSRKIIGILRTMPNGDQEAREFSSRRVLGYYRKHIDTTTDFYGKMIAKGNCVTAFIFDAYNKKKGK